ncbi:hypothetical protein KQI88_00600 [Alkaliphilus sp. MSJ-5]|uniref:Helix-turn-helix type 11 domain-containing protein n=1 Tax=Alkaliphilus flagellatus TaxID=2841507 RepID=A0ABS6FXU6_9FIRM|nr:hypothetical protein [Alkaliphilus flagellatus]MBU5674913.1 hypothetical protein [Alkaliphilus flagellatus]
MGINYSSYNTNDQESLTNPKIPWWLSFPALTIITMLSFPVGIFLIWKRTKVDTNSKGIIITVFGGILVFIGTLAFVILVIPPQDIDNSDINVIVFFLILGFSLIFLGRKKRKDAEKLKKYISIILTNKETSINNIAAAIPTSYKTAKKDIQNLIKKGYLTGIYINEATGEIIFPREQRLNYGNVHSNQETRSNQAPRSNVYTSVHSTTTTSGNVDPDTARRVFENLQPLMDMAFNTDSNINTNTNNNRNTNTSETVVACKGCGANNRIIRGNLAECQYCGSPIDN